MSKRRREETEQADPPTQTFMPVPEELRPEPPRPRRIDPIGVLIELLNEPGLSPVNWHISRSTPVIDGFLYIYRLASGAQNPVTVEHAHHVAETFARFVTDAAGVPATIYPEPDRTPDGHGTRLTVGGVRNGVPVRLAVLLPPPEPSTSPAPATAPVPIAGEQQAAQAVQEPVQEGAA